MVKDEEEASRTKLAALTEAGVNTFIDLTAPVKLKPYAQWLDSERQTYYRFPFKHMDAPGSRETIGAILDTIDIHIAQGDIVYLHCWGGVGRTGSTVISWLVRHGYPSPAALERLAELWAHCPRSARKPSSPETEEQHQYVRSRTEVIKVSGLKH